MPLIVIPENKKQTKTLILSSFHHSSSYNIDLRLIYKADLKPIQFNVITERVFITIHASYENIQGCGTCITPNYLHYYSHKTNYRNHYKLRNNLQSMSQLMI